MSKSENNVDILKILLITAVPPPYHGGIANWTRLVRKELEDKPDIQFAFVDTRPKGHILFGSRLLARMTSGSAQAFRIIGNTIWQLHKHPDVMHLNTSGSLGSIRDILLLYLAKWFHVPSIIHYHMQQPPAEVSHHGLLWRLLLWAMSLADVVVLLDQRSLKCIKDIMPGKSLAILPTMVEMHVIDKLVQHVKPRDADDLVRIIFVGYVRPVKGVRELVQACARLGNRRFELNFIGMLLYPKLQRELETLAATSSQQGWLHFFGNKEVHAEVLQHILASDILILPSHAESAPASILEGMGCGKPVIGTFTGAIPEMLDIGGPQQCGICVPPRDMDALTEALVRLIDHPEERQTLGRIAQQRVREHYDVPIGCLQLLQLWQQTIIER